MLRSLIQPAQHPPVQPQRDEWLRGRDETSAAGPGSVVVRTDGGGAGLSTARVYAIVTILIAIVCAMNVFADARDIAWRLGTPHNFWEPTLWELTGGIVAVALLPLPRCGALLIRTGTHRLLRTAFGVIALLVTYSVLHITGMALLREFAYRIAGWAYSYPWTHEALYEFRRDAFAFTAMAVTFWLAERPAVAAPVKAEEIATAIAEIRPAAPELWLRDGRISILIDPCNIVSVISAGNYVEFQLTGGRSHLIRTTLQAQEARLAPFGIVRVHRSRLVNPKRIVALEWRASGDFELRLDSGEAVAGSRRFKAAVAGIAT
jgi:DNA-binding LytR/AlgR family response regulator